MLSNFARMKLSSFEVQKSTTEYRVKHWTLFPMIGTAKSHSRWSRLRLIASWVVWLAVYYLGFRADAGVLPFLLLCVAGALRPRPLKDATDNQRLGGAIAALVAIPLIAVLLGSESTLEFL